MERSESIAALTVALAKAQGEMEAAKKTSANPYYHSKYADLAEVWDTCREPLSQNGLAILQTTEVNEEGKISLRTTLCHNSGEWVAGIIPLNAAIIDSNKNVVVVPAHQASPQALGSAITYARRYGLSAMVGIAPEEDDGNAASGRDTKQPQPKEVIPAPQAKAKTSTAMSIQKVGFEGMKARMLELDNLPAQRNFWKKHEAEIKTLSLEQQAELKKIGEESKEKFIEGMNAIPEKWGDVPAELLSQARIELGIDKYSYVKIADNAVIEKQLLDKVEELFAKSC